MSILNEKILDFRLLEVFLAVMSCGSITGAAQMTGCSQPAATRMVRDLESAVGFQLFHRNGPRITPTERGMRFHEEANRVVAGMHQIRDRANAIRDDFDPAIDIAATPTMAGGLVGAILARIEMELPQVIDIQSLNAERVVRNILTRRADVGLSAFPLDYAGLDMHAVCESQCVAVVAEDSPLAKRDILDLDALHDTRLLTVGNAYRLRRSIDKALLEAGVETKLQYTSNSSLNAVMAARSGLGVSIVDPVTAYGVPVPGTHILPLSVAIPYIWGVFTANDRIVSPLISTFIDAFQAICCEIVPNCKLHDPAGESRFKQLFDLSKD